ncbi:L-type lectin-domain containing receptor kinase IX.1-like [Cocos nucifera]|uniref:non-specific serine/threonine protein kinase n=1 Tax=Cocos nucifera TaxID=13894 RepID=A0A8K0HXB5_COCNU|nr:L-type lectin-domain containing receptor kinase IX.1-like [Cocos nucifera]
MAPCNSRSLHILLLLSQLLSILIPLASPLSFKLTGNKLNQPNLNFSNDTTFGDNAIQLTKNQWGGTITQSIGSATYPEPMPLWDKASGTLANFTTNFSFAFDKGDNNNPGDGLAFFLSPFPFEAPPNSAGGGFGLFNATSENNVVAVEFDSYRNLPFNDTFTIHAGIDVRSLRSKKQLYLNDGIEKIVQFNASVSYNAITGNLSVFVSNASDPRMNWSLSYVVDLKDYLPENVAIGFSASTGDSVELHSIYTWEFSSDLSSIEVKKKSKMRLVVGLSVGIGILLCGQGLAWYAIWRNRASGGMEAEEEEEMALELSINNAFERGGGPRKFSYGALAIATRNFVKEAKLGEGGFGEVYMGVLDDTKQQVAIKRISRDSKQGKKEYISEVTIISRLRHRNLVQLIGYCHERGDLLLVYEYMSNKSLDYHLYSEERLLTWPERYQIAFGLASALLYLHEEWEQCVVHRDVKPSNVMLDSVFNAKLGDFGLARLVDHESNMQTTVMAGTRGYMAPEYATTGK